MRTMGLVVPCKWNADAASQTWSATPTDANWTTLTNWVAGAVPGVIYVSGNTVNNGIVTLNSPITTFGGSVSPIQVDLTRHIGSITYDTANAGAHVVGRLAVLHPRRSRSSLRPPESGAELIDPIHTDRSVRTRGRSGFSVSGCRVSRQAVIVASRGNAFGR